MLKTGELLDRKRLEMMTSSREQEEELFNLFFQGADEKMELVSRTSREETGTIWRQVIHNLRGSAANLGLKAILQKCTEAEKLEFSQNIYSAIYSEIQNAREYLISCGYKLQEVLERRK